MYHKVPISMSNINSLLFVLLINSAAICFGQEEKTQDTVAYITYRVPKVEYHHLELSNKEVFVRIPQRHMFPEMLYKLNLKRQDSIYSPTQEPEAGGISDRNPLIKRLEKGSLRIVSKNEVILETQSHPQPYLRKYYVDSLIGKDHTVFFVNGQLLKIGNDKNIHEQIDPLLQNPKKPKIAVLDGKEGYEKYGAVGILGVIEYYDKKCRKKKR